MAIVRFIDRITFDTTTGELQREGITVRLEPQPAAVLACLASSPGQLVSHDELRRAVWGDTTHVKLTDALHYCIRQIRAALGDDARQPRFIETIPRRGYRMKADTVIADLDIPTRATPPAERRRTLQWWTTRAALAAAFALLVVVVEQRPNRHHQIAVTVLQSLHDLMF